MTWSSPAAQSCVSVQQVNQTPSIYHHYSLLHQSRCARLLQQHPSVVSIAVDPFNPPGASLQATRTKGISDHQQHGSGAEMALFQKVSMRSSGSGRSPTASVPIFCLLRSSGLKGSDLCPVNTIRRTSLSNSHCVLLLGTKCPGPD